MKIPPERIEELEAEGSIPLRIGDHDVFYFPKNGQVEPPIGYQNRRGRWMLDKVPVAKLILEQVTGVSLDDFHIAFRDGDHSNLALRNLSARILRR